MDIKDKSIPWLDAMEPELDHRVVQYLLENHMEYQKLREKLTEESRKCSVITRLVDATGEIHFTSEEHQIYLRYRQLQENMEAVERKYLYLMGQADMVPYCQTLLGLSRKGAKRVKTPIQHMNLESWQMELINYAVIKAEQNARENCRDYGEIIKQISDLNRRYPFIDRLMDQSKITEGRAFSVEELQAISDCLRLENDKRYIEETELYLKGIRDGYALKKILEP